MVIALAILGIICIFLIIQNTVYRTKARKSKAERFEYISELAEKMKGLRVFRHDYKNKMYGLKILLEKGEYEKAIEYITSMEAEFEPASNELESYSDNILINAVLSELAAKCRKSDITFNALLTVGNELPLSDTEICSMFSNIADNAYEAVMRQITGDKFITFNISRREKWTVITAENSFDGKLKTNTHDELSTTKKDVFLHGLGIKSIKHTVESVPGAKARIETEDNVFRISLIFPKN